MYTLKKQLLKEDHRVRPGGSFEKYSVTIHSTGNEASTAQNERDWLDNPKNYREAGWHYVVGDGIVIQAIPDREAAWHCGVTAGNRFSIGIEITESGDRGRVLETAAAFTADKLRELRLTVEDLKTHKDWSGKECPRILIQKGYIKDGMDWDWFVKRVKAYEKKEDVMTSIEAKNIIREKCGFDDNTMKYLEFYRYADSLIQRLAEAMR